MKRENVRKYYEDATTSLSSVTRQLALAGIAVIWLVRTGETHGVLVFSSALHYSLIFYVIALSCDLLQYTYQSLAWGILNRRKEKLKVPADHEFLAPASINWAALFFFWAKVIFTIAGYVVLICVIGSQLLCAHTK